MLSDEELRNTYNPEGSDLRRLQLRMLEILIEVDRICKKHNINYWLSSGTLLGAVRHKGFIPWDDDLDIEMLREDYIRLLDILPKELSESYVLQTDKTDNNYVYLYAKIRDTHSYIKEKCTINQNLKCQGAFVDIFPIESTPLLISKISAKLFNRLCFNLVLKKGLGHYLYNINRKILLNILFPFFRFISRAIGCKEYHHTLGVNFLTPRIYDDIFPLSEICFETFYFNAPKKIDSYLKRMYGDYMKVPDIITSHRVENEIKIW